MIENNSEKIKVLENDIKQLITISKANNIDLSDKINSLNEKLEKLKEDAFSHLSAYEKVTLSRDIKRPTTLEYIEHICSNFLEIGFLKMTLLWLEELVR